MTITLRNLHLPIDHRMLVLDARGNRVGRVDGLAEGNEIRLTRDDSPDGVHHYIPLDWVAEIGRAVHLNKCCVEIYRDRA